MTSDDRPGSEEKGRSEWLEQADEAFERVGRALRAAWEASREERVGAMETARDAVGRLSEAIDKGVAAARTRWSEARPEPERKEPPPEEVMETPLATEPTPEDEPPG